MFRIISRGRGRTEVHCRGPSWKRFLRHRLHLHSAAAAVSSSVALRRSAAAVVSEEAKESLSITRIRRFVSRIPLVIIRLRRAQSSTRAPFMPLLSLAPFASLCVQKKDNKQKKIDGYQTSKRRETDGKHTPDETRCRTSSCLVIRRRRPQVGPCCAPQNAQA